MSSSAEGEAMTPSRLPPAPYTRTGFQVEATTNACSSVSTMCGIRLPSSVQFTRPSGSGSNAPLGLPSRQHVPNRDLPDFPPVEHDRHRIVLVVIPALPVH